MRRLIGLVAVSFSVQAIVSGQAPGPGTPSELADDVLAGALWRIAVATHTKIGFESVEFVRLWGRLNRVPTFPVASRDEALTSILDADPRYEWRAVGDSIVVRPKGAWNESANPLNRPVRNLRVEKAQPYAVIVGVRDFIYRDTFAVPPMGQAIPVSFDVPSGTVIDVLNQTIESSDAVLWIASYRPSAQPDQRYPRSDLQMQLMDATRMRSRSISHSPRGLH